MFEHKFFLNPCFKLNVLTLSLEHVLPYKFFPFNIYNSEIHYNQTIINISKYILQDIISKNIYVFQI